MLLLCALLQLRWMGYCSCFGLNGDSFGPAIHMNIIDAVRNSYEKSKQIFNNLPANYTELVMDRIKYGSEQRENTHEIGIDLCAFKLYRETTTHSKYVLCTCMFLGEWFVF